MSYFAKNILVKPVEKNTRMLFIPRVKQNKIYVTDKIPTGVMKGSSAKIAAYLEQHKIEPLFEIVIDEETHYPMVEIDESFSGEYNAKIDALATTAQHWVNERKFSLMDLDKFLPDNIIEAIVFYVADQASEATGFKPEIEKMSQLMHNRKLHESEKYVADTLKLDVGKARQVYSANDYMINLHADNKKSLPGDISDNVADNNTRHDLSGYQGVTVEVDKDNPAATATKRKNTHTKAKA